MIAEHRRARRSAADTALGDEDTEAGGADRERRARRRRAEVIVLREGVRSLHDHVAAVTGGGDTAREVERGTGRDRGGARGQTAGASGQPTRDERERGDDDKTCQKLL